MLFRSVEAAPLIAADAAFIPEPQQPQPTTRDAAAEPVSEPLTDVDTQTLSTRAGVQTLADAVGTYQFSNEDLLALAKYINALTKKKVARSSVRVRDADAAAIPKTEVDAEPGPLTDRVDLELLDIEARIP